MKYRPRIASLARRRCFPKAEVLEARALLSASSADRLGEVSIEVPSTYVSEQASAIDVTLVRKGSAASIAANPLSLDVRAAASASAGSSADARSSVDAAVDLDESVTLAAGQKTTVVAVPVNANPATSGLVPVEIAVSQPQHPAKQAIATVYLATGPDAVPPIITAAHLTARAGDHVQQADGARHGRQPA